MNLDMFNNVDGLVIREKADVLRGLPKYPSAYTESGSAESAFPKCTPIGMAYVPYQDWGTMQPPEDALSSGSLFAELVYPFEGGGVLNSGGGK